jgi:hypothetical protein
MYVYVACVLRHLIFTNLLSLSNWYRKQTTRVTSQRNEEKISAEEQDSPSVLFLA